MAKTTSTQRAFLRLGLFLAAIATAGFCHAQAQGPAQVYRYVDEEGRVVYSDKPPPANAKNAQAKRITSNLIETSELGYASQIAQERFPVTLYSFACGEICDNAEALLNRRGVPHATVNVSELQGAEQLKRLTGGQDAPVLQVGDAYARGFNDSKWQSMLDDAGYPKAPAPRRAPARTAAVAPAEKAAPLAPTAEAPSPTAYPR